MGYPAAGVVAVPGVHPDLAAVVEAIPLDPLGRRAELAGALRGGSLAPGRAAVGSGHLCVTAWVFDAHRTHVLLVRHLTLGWVQPGGHLDPGEAPCVGAARELHEETGLALRADHGDVPALLHPAVFPARGAHPAHVHWNLGYRYTAALDDELTPEDRCPVAWFPIDGLPTPTTPDVAPIVALLTG